MSTLKVNAIQSNTTQSINVNSNLGNISNIEVAGVGTFSGGPVIIGSTTNTGTVSQSLQVTGGAYISGNLGVGITNPAEKLDIIGALKLQGSAGNNAVVSSIIYKNYNSIGFDVVSLDTLTGSNIYEGVFRIQTKDSGGTLAERLRLTSGGNFGIGTTNPPGKFAISGTTADTFAAVLSNPNNRVRGDYQRAFGTAHPVVIIGNNDRNTDGENGVLCLYAGDLTSSNGNYCGALEFGAPETGKSNANASLKAYIAGGLEGSGGSTGGVGGNIQFATRGDNASGVPIERMRIDSTGRITASYQPSFSAYHSVNQNISANTWTKVSLNTTRFNIGSNYNTSTSNFTAPVSGRYFVSYTIQFDLQTVEYLYSAIKINGNFYHYGEGRRLLNPGGGTWGGDNTLNAAQLVNLAANDTVDLWAYSTAANTLSGGDLRASFAIHLLG